jgi:mRNA interferase RelE/StbE
LTASEWRIEFDSAAAKELKALGASEQRRILKFLRDRVATREDPRRMDHALTGEFSGLWRYRVGDYRLIVAIEDKHLVVLVLRIGHRRQVYR